MDVRFIFDIGKLVVVVQVCNRGARDEGFKRRASVTNRYIEPLVEPTCARNRHSSVVELRSSFGNDISPVAV
jgi:hypothetical protein